MADLSIIIVNWNVRDLLDRCLSSIYDSQAAVGRKCKDLPQLEILVVDCASADDSVSMVSEKYPDVVLLPQDENIGFSRGNNLAMSAATAPVFLLLNPDTEVSEDAIFQMLQYLESHPTVGILGPHTLNSDGSHQSTRRRFPSVLTGVFESTWLSALAPAAIHEHYYMRDSDDDAILEVDWVQGSAMMLRRQIFAAIGGLDDGFVMYSEELDYCRRAKSAGWKVIYHGGARITHHGGKSSDQAPAFAQIQFHTSKLRYFRKHHGLLSYLLLRALILLQFLWQLALESIKAVLGHKRDLRLQRIRVYWQVIRSGLKAET